MDIPKSHESGCLPDAVSRLSNSAAGQFLAPHHQQAARRLAQLFERACLRQRVTMSYDPARVGRTKGAPQGDLADSAADARKRLAALAGRMPADCWSVLTDVCLYDRGLQDIETERGWPRRAAKLVLRIGLDQAAGLLGLTEKATGNERAAMRHWLPERAPMFQEVE
jgi:hypothetical protein